MGSGGGTYNWDGASAAETLTDQERIFRRRQAKCSRLIDRTLAQELMNWSQLVFSNSQAEALKQHREEVPNPIRLGTA